MIPVIRFAESSSEIQWLAAKLEAKRLSGSFGVQREPVSPEKFICIVVGIVSMISMTWMTTAFGHRLNPTLGWLAGPFLLLIFYVSYAARSEANFWYPYDLPHYAIFGAACLAIFEGSWFLFLALFVLDVPVRETGVFLLPAVLLLTWRTAEFKRGLTVTAIAAAVWVSFRIHVTHLFAHNPTELGIHKSQMIHALTNPLHWPQDASALGFLLVPMLLGRALLTRRHKLFVTAALPGFLVTLLYGVWYESRIFDEWAVAVAVLLSTQLNTLLTIHTDEAVEAARLRL
jgi:hypothetical protein